MIKTTTLETSQLLRDAGFRQNFTYFYYRKMWNPTSVGDGEYYPLRTYDEIDEKDAEYAYAAPTTDELLEDITDKDLLEYYARNIEGETIGDLNVFLSSIMDMVRDCDKLAHCWLWSRKDNS